MRLRNRAGPEGPELETLAAELARLESLADVLAWGRAQPRGSVRPGVVTEVIAQDEFTHDAIVPWREGRTLVFGAT